MHYQLGTVLEFVPNRRSDALSHVERALESFKARITELKAESKEAVSEEVSKMSDKEREADLKDVESLVGDIEVKIEELKAAPASNDLISESINHLRGSSSSAAQTIADSGPVNDLTSMVKKKAPKAKAAAQAVLDRAAAAADQAGGAVGEGLTSAGQMADHIKEMIKNGAAELAGEVARSAEAAKEALENGDKRKGENGQAAEDRPSKRAKEE